MRNYRYPGLDQHAQEHLQFMYDLTDLQEISYLDEVYEQMIIVLYDGLLEHIRSSDRQFASWLGVVGKRGEGNRVLDVG